MAKKIRFPLEMKDGAEVRNLEELKENFSLEHVLVYLEDGKLITWLRDRYENEIADAVLALNREDADFYKKICDIFEVECVETQEDIEKAMERKRKEALLKECTDEEKFYEVVEQIAFTQDDLYDLLDGEETEIYLCGREFAIPLEKKGIHYIGINNPVAVIVSKEKVDFEEKGITFLGIQFDEKYAEILAAGISSNKLLENDSKLVQNANDMPDTFGNEDLTRLPEPADKLTDEEMRQIKYLIVDLNRYIDSFLEKTLKKYENVRIVSVSDSSFNKVVCDNKYNRLFQRSEEARDAIESFIDDVYIHYAIRKGNEIMDGYTEFVKFIERDIVEFAEEFKNSSINFIYQDCEGEARIFADKNIMAVVDKDEMIMGFEIFHFMEKVETYIQELYSKPMKRELKIRKDLKVEEYYMFCESWYNGSKIGIYKAIKAIWENTVMLFDETFEILETKIRELYQSVLTDYCERTKEKLLNVLSERKDVSDDNFSSINIFSRIFGDSKKTEENQLKKAEERITEVTSWWDQHLSNAHKSSDR